MPREPYHEIGELLRSHKPDPRPSPGLEARIVRSLHTPQTESSGRIWPWFLLPPAVAAGILMMWPQPMTKPTVTRQDPPPHETTRSPEASGRNPIEQESIAIQNDARRASRFLIDCLPGLAAPVK